MKANYRTLEYHNLIVNTHSGTTTKVLEKYDYFSVNANPAPDGYTFDKWTGDTHSFNNSWWNGGNFDVTEPKTGTYMGASDRTITATYRLINSHTLTVKQLSGDVTYKQAEFSTVTFTAEDAPEGKRFKYWSLSGEGKFITTSTGKTVTFEFGNGNATVTPIYVNVWTITVIDGTINGASTALLDEGTQYSLSSNSLKVYERFDGWTQTGPGTISNTATSSTYFTVGAGNATLTAHISQYPDKTLTIYWRHPKTAVDTLVSQTTYTYGTKITDIRAEVAPDKSTFSTWLGDVNLLSPSALASTVTINSLTADTTIIATYFYPESPKSYILTVYDGYPESGEYQEGSQISITARTPNEGWEFCTWYGDTKYLVDPDLTHSENSVIIPAKSITLYAKFNVIGQPALWRVSVVEGIASATYYTDADDGTKEQHDVSGVYIDVPEGTEVTLTADPDTTEYEFSSWTGNFDQAGVTDIVPTNNPTVFTMPRANVNVTMVRKQKQKYKIYSKNATTLGEVFPGEYSISGTLQDTDDYHYKFEYWICTDLDGNDCISAIAAPNELTTTLTVTDKDLSIEAVYTTYYKLTVVEGQDTGEGYYCENQTVNTIRANTPTAESRLQFDHWDDPMGIVKNIYDKTPTVVMKNTVATITAVFTSIDAKGNSIAVTGDDIHDKLITRTDSYLINGVYAVGTIVFDKDGCIGVITKIDPDNNDDTDDYLVEKLFYGGNF